MINKLKEIYTQNSLIVAEAHIPETWRLVGKYTDNVYVWRGGCTINIHEPAWEKNPELDYTEPGKELDAFILYGDDKGSRPNLSQVTEEIAEREIEELEEMRRRLDETVS
jgi:hypothetical protein